MSPLKKEEEKYLLMVYPKGVPNTQHWEIAMAFNAGALTTLTLVGAISKGTEDEAVKALQALMNEAEARCVELCELPKANPHN